jgi:hypothetical protein
VKSQHKYVNNRNHAARFGWKVEWDIVIDPSVKAVSSRLQVLLGKGVADVGGGATQQRSIGACVAKIATFGMGG